MASVLVTGGAGFIGGNVAQRLVDAGHEVVVLDDLSGGSMENVPVGAEFRQGDICDERLVRWLFSTRKFEYVFHLAAYAAEGLSHFIRRHNYQNNLIGSVNLINVAVSQGGVRRFVFTSSLAVYGTAHLPMYEAMTPAPEDPYGIGKWAVEQDLKCAHEMFGLPYVIFRPHNVYGERQNLRDPYRNVVAIFMRQVMRKEPMTVFGDGEQTRSFSYIDDVAAPIAASIMTPGAVGRTFNVGGGASTSVNRLAVAVAQAFGVEARITYLDARHEVEHTAADHSRLEAVFGERTPVSLQDGLSRMATWARSQRPQGTRPFPGRIEVTRNLPASWQALTRGPALASRA